MFGENKTTQYKLGICSFYSCGVIVCIATPSDEIYYLYWMKLNPIQC